MSTGNSRASRRAFVALAIAAVGIAPAVGQAGDAPRVELEQLMHELRQVKTARARFTERKYLAILSTPLESSGTLLYVAPGKLEKHMLSPRQESLVLDGDTLSIEKKDTGERRSFPVQQNPVLWALVEGLRSTLAGDLQTLRRFYEVSLEGDARGWRLRLRPSERRVRELAAEIRVSGSGAALTEIEILEAGGDRSVMTITRDAA